VSGEWPTGALGRNAPEEAKLAAGIARRLAAAQGARSLRQLAAETGVSPGTLSNLLAGRSWGDVVTIARLETGLGVPLWGSEHLHARHQTAPARGGKPKSRTATRPVAAPGTVSPRPRGSQAKRT
jgi:transcriptional regulator with XRE-family HTH domain